MVPEEAAKKVVKFERLFAFHCPSTSAAEAVVEKPTAMAGRVDVRGFLRNEEFRWNAEMILNREECPKGGRNGGLSSKKPRGA